MEAPVFRLRQATHDDYDFLYRLHVAAMKEVVAQVWGWDDTQQEEFFAARFDAAATRIVTVDGRAVGMIVVEWSETEACIERIEILPEYQGRGLGAAIFGQVLGEADARRLPVRLRVLKVNPAQRLYTRLGFIVTGETETHLLMQRLPSSEPV